MRTLTLSIVLAVVLAVLLAVPSFAGAVKPDTVRSSGTAVDTNAATITNTGYGTIVNGKIIFHPDEYSTLIRGPGEIDGFKSSSEQYEYAVQGSSVAGTRINDLRVNQAAGSFTKEELLENGLLDMTSETRTLTETKSNYNTASMGFGSIDGYLSGNGMSRSNIVGWDRTAYWSGDVYAKKTTTTTQNLGTTYEDDGTTGVWLFNGKRYDFAFGGSQITLDSRGTGVNGQDYFNVKIETPGDPPATVELRSDPLWFENNELMGEVKQGRFHIDLGDDSWLALDISPLSTKTNFTSGYFITGVEVFQGTKSESFKPNVSEMTYYNDIKAITTQKQITTTDFYKIYASDLYEWPPAKSSGTPIGGRTGETW